MRIKNGVRHEGQGTCFPIKDGFLTFKGALHDGQGRQTDQDMGARVLRLRG